MRKLRLLILLLFQVSYVCSQNSDKLVSWEKVEVSPVFPGCSGAQAVKDCSKDAFIEFVKTEFDHHKLPDSIPEHLINFKIIIGTNGALRWSSVQASNEIIKSEAERILQKLPEFTPGSHQGKPVNVMANFSIKLEKSSEIYSLASVDVPPVPEKCIKKEDKEKCLSQWIANYVNSSFDTDIFNKEHKGTSVFSTYVSFVIDENGEITKVKASGDYEIMNREAIRVVKTIPPVNPAMKDNHPTAVNYHMPITVGVSSRR